MSGLPETKNNTMFIGGDKIDLISAQNLPDDWDDDYKQVWQRWHETQDKLRAQRSMRKLLEEKLDAADELINALYESGEPHAGSEALVQKYIHG